MYGLTLWRPWEHAIICGGKEVENRPQPPAAKALGKRIAIHAGLKYRLGSYPREEGWDPPAITATAPGRIYGTVLLLGYLDLRKPGARVFGIPEGPLEGEYLLTGARRYISDEEVRGIVEADCSPWWAGPVGWVLADPILLDEWAPRRPGALGLWTLTDREETLVRVAETRARQPRKLPGAP